MQHEVAIEIRPYNVQKIREKNLRSGIVFGLIILVSVL